MQDYDAALKLLLRQTAPRAVEMLCGVSISHWLDIELPKAQNLRMDLLGEDAKGQLHHFELQSRNDSRIHLRMAEYALGTFRITGRLPLQTALYVGEAPMNMPAELRGPDLWIRYRLIDIRDLDGEQLLASPNVGDNVMAVLTRLRDRKEAVRSIVRKIIGRSDSERNTAIQQLFILAGLRGLEQLVREEVEKMPLEIDIMANKVLGPAIRQGLEQGREEGRAEGELHLLRLQLQRRFGPLPQWATAKLNLLSVAEIEVLADQIFDAPTIESLLGKA